MAFGEWRLNGKRVTVRVAKWEGGKKRREMKMSHCLNKLKCQQKLTTPNKPLNLGL